MAGNRKKARHNPGFQRYNAEKRWIKNKEARAVRHEEHMRNLTILSNRRKELLEVCMEQYSASEYALKRIFGTLSTKRLTDIESGKFASQDWFQSRVLTPTLEKIASRTRIKRVDLEAMKPYVEEEVKHVRRKKKHRVHKGPNSRNRKVQRGPRKKDAQKSTSER